MTNKLAETIVFQESHGIKTMKFTFPPESRPLEGYTIKRGIERGGFGEVYYALSDAGKEVALKLLQQNLEIELRGVTQCLNLKHPNLVNLFDIRTDEDGDHWIIMEFVAGKTLDAEVAQHPNGMAVELVQQWLTGLAAGLGFLHDRGIVHRDLKPGNVFIEQGVVKIGDVGLSKFITQSRRGAQTQSVGTVYYMAPEVAHGRYGREVDVYSLGVMLYEMLTGKVPFDGESTAEILMKHLSEKPDLTPIPERLRPVLAAVLEKDPLRRTPDAATLVRDFNNAVLGFDVPHDIPDASFQPDTAERSGSVPVSVSAPSSRPVRPHVRTRERHRRPPAQQTRRTPEQTEHSYQVLGTVLRWLAAGIILMMVFSSGALWGLIRFLFVGGLLGGICFVGYRLIQFIGRAVRNDNTSLADTMSTSTVEPVASGSPAASPVVAVRARKPQPAARRRRRTVLKLNPAVVRAIPFKKRITDLTASLTFAVFATAVLTLGLCLSTSLLTDASQIALFAGTTLFGAWGILTVSKLQEGRDVETGINRFALLLVGALVGGGAFWLDHTLMVDLPVAEYGQPYGLFQTVGPHDLLNGVQPAMAGYMVFFAGLFALRRWWWHADSFRERHFRVATVLLTLSLGYVLSTIWVFPQVWALTWAAAISSVVQVSAVWVPTAERAKLTEGESHGS